MALGEPSRPAHEAKPAPPVRSGGPQLPAGEAAARPDWELRLELCRNAALLIQERLTESDVDRIADALGAQSLLTWTTVDGKAQAMSEKCETLAGALPARLKQVYEETGRHQPFDAVGLARSWYMLPLDDLLEFISRERACDMRLVLHATGIAGRNRSTKDMVRAARTWWVDQVRDGLQCVSKA